MKPGARVAVNGAGGFVVWSQMVGGTHVVDAACVRTSGRMTSRRSKSRPRRPSLSSELDQYAAV